MLRILGTIVTAFALVAVGPSAWAGDGGAIGNGTGGGWSPGPHGPVMTKQEITANRAKQAKARAYSIRVEQALQKGEAAAGTAASIGTVHPDMCTPTVPCPPTSRRILGVKHSGQVKGYYCGPASGFMILRYEREGRAADTNVTLNQGHVAGYHHMRTDYYGKTSWYNSYRPFRAGLNHWRGNKFYHREPSPTNSTFRHDLHYDIDHGMPFGVSTVEYASKAHYNYHPKSELIGHWVVGQGYKNNLATTSFDDPAANASGLSSRWDNVRANFTYGTNGFNGTFVSPHGIVW